MTTDHAPRCHRDCLACCPDRARPASPLNAVRRTSAHVCRYGGLLEAELGHFLQLEPYMDRAVRHVEARTSEPISDELHERLCDSLGVSEVQIVLE